MAKRSWGYASDSHVPSGAAVGTSSVRVVRSASALARSPSGVRTGSMVMVASKSDRRSHSDVKIVVQRAYAVVCFGAGDLAVCAVEVRAGPQQLAIQLGRLRRAHLGRGQQQHGAHRAEQIPAGGGGHGRGGVRVGRLGESAAVYATVLPSRSTSCINR